MSRYIDVDKFIEDLGFENTEQEREENIGEIVTLEDFDRQPTADVVEVIHSEWHTATVRMSCIDVTCRNCHNTEKISVTNYFEYCPHCGAKMDGERKDENDD